MHGIVIFPNSFGVKSKDSTLNNERVLSLVADSFLSRYRELLNMFYFDLFDVV